MCGFGGKDPKRLWRLVFLLFLSLRFSSHTGQNGGFLVSEFPDLLMGLLDTRLVPGTRVDGASSDCEM